MSKKPELFSFERVPNRVAVLVDNGVFVEADVYRFALVAGELPSDNAAFVKYKGGFVKLHPKANKGNTYGLTSHAKVRWVHVIDDYRRG